MTLLSVRKSMNILIHAKKIVTTQKPPSEYKLIDLHI